jgi:hypothetical protein
MTARYVKGNAQLYWLALGSFTMGSKSFKIAGPLRGMTAERGD